MKMTKKQLEELVDKSGALIGSKSISPKYGNTLVGSYETTDDYVEKTTQDKSYQTPYRRYMGEDDLSNHPLFDISKKAKSYTQFKEMVKKLKPKMSDEDIEEDATLFGYRKDKKRIVKEKEMTESILRFSDGVSIDTSGELRTLELSDGWYVVGEGKLIPVKDEGEAKTLVIKMGGKPIEERMNFYTKDDKWFSSSEQNSDSVKRHKERFGDDITFSVDGYIGKFNTWSDFLDSVNENKEKNVPSPYTLPSSRMRLSKYEIIPDDINYFNGLIGDKDTAKNAIEKIGLGKYKKLLLATAKHHYILGDGKAYDFPKEEYNELIDSMLKDIGVIEESANSLLEKIVKIKTKDDVLPKMIKSNNHIDKAISHLKGSMDEIEKYKSNPKVSGVYKSIEKTIKLLESIVDKIEDKTDLMDSINENNGNLSPEGAEKYNRLFGNRDENYKLGYEQGYYNGFLDGKNNTTFNNDISWNKYSSKKDSISNTPTNLSFDEEIKRDLRKLYSGSIYDKVGKIDVRIDQLIDIHKTWLDKVRNTYSASEIADKLFKYEKNLKNG
jgi:hypothetical protein